ncbi:Cys-tRNA(Pro) deacylase [Treponema phagedenis]|uniref:Cys-tRNA(Pro)/Cys-tRNA(Cys) deacylase n=2 Tax=Treponema phagedenis TaxID=162 RepID=A0AAE6IXL9_TREPH|nr:Cys-tRNA(Pro) deacylase [Treponema phagedenis]NVP23998.1 Cys-tRNA(Pro) deacylase [Treponema phagedenis]QEJ93862.1 Cys-tRNA(Pro) deacylase [Treponema phagedenis]QEJ99432.1 Cys-tRNA(Pro) deacylase [Treponema phagedenis]QEK02172.1 Cys-tRNA(Pro) deacylase [Treponema phagedenis]QEK05003.1 Cys-tRNA(Pro) deacylase [Treponema phagedenis]
MKKTNAMRILESKNIPFSVTEYEWDENYLDAVSAASKLNLDPDSVYKTIVMMNEKKEVFVFCVPAAHEVSLKKVRILTNSHLNPVKVAELQSITGYLRGGCSPIGMKKHFPVYIDESALKKEQIYISAGQRGMQLVLDPKDLQKACNAEFHQLIDG